MVKSLRCQVFLEGSVQYLDLITMVVSASSADKVLSSKCNAPNSIVRLSHIEEVGQSSPH